MRWLFRWVAALVTNCGGGPCLEGVISPELGKGCGVILGVVIAADTVVAVPVKAEVEAKDGVVIVLDIGAGALPSAS